MNAFITNSPSKEMLRRAGRIARYKGVQSFLDDFTRLQNSPDPTVVRNTLSPSIVLNSTINFSRRGDSGNGGTPPANEGGKGFSKGKGAYGLIDRESARVDFSTGNYVLLTTEFSSSGDTHSSCFYFASGELLPNFTKLGFPDSVLPGIGDVVIGRVYATIVARVDGIASAERLSISVLLAYFRAVSNGLQAYFTIDAMLTLYNNKGLTTNKAILHFRNRLTSEIISDFNRLQSELKDHFFPTKAYDFIRFMYQNFSFSDEPGAPIHRLVWRNLIAESNNNQTIEGSLESNILDELVLKLQDKRFSQVRNILAKNFDDLRVPLEPSFNEPIVSPGFRAFWTNQSVTYFNPLNKGSVLNTREVSGDEDFLYFIDENDIDEAIISMCSVNYNKIHTHGIWKPNTEINGISQDHYLNISRYGDDRFQGNIPAQLTSGCGIATVPVLRPDGKDFDIYTRIPAGFKKALFINGAYVNNIGKNVIQHLYEPSDLAKSSRDSGPNYVSKRVRK